MDIDTQAILAAMSPEQFRSFQQRRDKLITAANQREEDKRLFYHNLNYSFT